MPFWTSQCEEEVKSKHDDDCLHFVLLIDLTSELVSDTLVECTANVNMY